MLKLNNLKETRSIGANTSNLIEHLGILLFVLFIPLTAIIVMGVAFVAGIFTKGMVR
jgi:hypothetical protein